LCHGHLVQSPQTFRSLRPDFKGEYKSKTESATIQPEPEIVPIPMRESRSQ
jgi:hypothetical protein